MANSSPVFIRNAKTGVFRQSKLKARNFFGNPLVVAECNFCLNNKMPESVSVTISGVEEVPDPTEEFEFVCGECDVFNLTVECAPCNPFTLNYITPPFEIDEEDDPLGDLPSCREQIPYPSIVDVGPFHAPAEFYCSYFESELFTLRHCPNFEEVTTPEGGGGELGEGEPPPDPPPPGFDSEQEYFLHVQYVGGHPDPLEEPDLTALIEVNVFLMILVPNPILPEDPPTPTVIEAWTISFIQEQGEDLVKHSCMATFECPNTFEDQGGFGIFGCIFGSTLEGEGGSIATVRPGG